MNEIFADSFYYISLLNSRDAHHASVVAATEQLGSNLVTSVWVLMEVADALSIPYTRQRVWRFLNEIESDPITTVIYDLQPWYDGGLKLYGSRQTKTGPSPTASALRSCRSEASVRH